MFQHNASLVEQSGAATAELEIQTKILTDLVSVFKLPQGGSDDLNYRPLENPDKVAPQQEVIDDKK